MSNPTYDGNASPGALTVTLTQMTGAAVPEPSALALLLPAAGMGGGTVCGRRRRKS